MARKPTIDIQLIPVGNAFWVFPLTARGLAWLRAVTGDALWRDHDGFEHIKVEPDTVPILMHQT